MQGSNLAACGVPLPRLWEARRLTTVLTALGINQKVLAKGLGCSGPHLSRIIGGVRGITPDMLAKLRRAIGEAGWAYATGQSDALPTEGR